MAPGMKISEPRIRQEVCMAWQIAAAKKSYWVLAGATVSLPAFLFVFSLQYGIRLVHSTCVITSEGLRIDTPFYPRFIAESSILKDQVAMIDFQLQPEFAISRRVHGIGLSDLLVGWMEARNGQKTWVLITGRTNVVRIPLGDGDQVILSLVEPHRFVASLQGEFRDSQVFQVPPPGDRLLWIFGLLLLFLLSLAIFFFILVYQNSRIRFELTPQGLKIKALFYGRTIPLDCMARNDIQRIDLEKMGAFCPKLRINGTGMGGLQVGWFKLVNGAKGLVFLTNPQAILIPIVDGQFLLLISPSQPESLFSGLQQAINSTQTKIFET